MRGIIKGFNSKAIFKRRFLAFCQRVLSKEQDRIFLEFEGGGESLTLGTRCVLDQGGTVYVLFKGEEMPLCSFSLEDSEYKLNLPLYHALLPHFLQLEEDYSIFSSK